jgi:hypothetical protein
MKMIEKMKERQKLEARSIIEFEIKQQILRKEQKDHTNKVRLDKEKDIRDLIRHKKKQDLKDRKKELESNLKEAMDIINPENNKEKENEEKVKKFYFGMAPEDAKDLIEYNITQIDQEINKINKEEDEDNKRK